MRKLALVLSAFFAVLSPLGAEERAPATTACRGATEPSMPGFVSAARDEGAAPRYPSIASFNSSEGWVLLSFAVTAQGNVRDIEVVDAMGGREFADSATKAVSTWRFKPATRNGARVEQALCMGSVLYLMEGSRRVSENAQFANLYGQARGEIDNGRIDDAIATLERAQRLRLNLYEEAMSSYALALAYSAKGDWEHALIHAEHAVIEDAKYLERRVKANALAMLVDLRTQNGEFAGALAAFDELRKVDPNASGSAATNVARIKAALARPAPIVIPARLAKHPLIDAPASWRHNLLRSKFSFAEIVGEVKSVHLTCVGTALDAAVDGETEWTVPDQAGPCILRVDGAPGASFKLIEE